jgi:hypothetical protein
MGLQGYVSALKSAQPEGDKKYKQLLGFQPIRLHSFVDECSRARTLLPSFPAADMSTLAL